MPHQTILVLDFGSQFTQLIARRLRELSVYSEILPFNTPPEAIRAKQPQGLILSGGPSSVSDPGAPRPDPGVLALGLPTLGICYGMQLMTDMLGGAVARAPHREFGHALVRRENASARMLRNLPGELRVWASHGDVVTSVPPGFQVTATSANAPVAAMEAPDRGYYGLLFHPEVVHTDRGADMLRNFAFDVCGCSGDWTIRSFIDESTARIRAQAGEGRVVCALSGGVDSTVAATLIHHAIGDRLQC
ncbi:MAG: glutamine-hydrolyzing GMP synthase, partial [Acidobacteriota bacterium]|nr:glutamine-hydrolyzing GMP synthase [Acidobacteriota bacterium]